MRLGWAFGGVLGMVEEVDKSQEGLGANSEIRRYE